MITQVLRGFGQIMLRYNLIQLTFPFVTASCITLGIKYLRNIRNS